MPIVDIPVKSSVELKPIAARYTCDGSNVSPPLTWSKVPAHTAEIDVFIGSLENVNGKLFIDWAVAGLKPSVHRLSAGSLPSGAIPGRNGYGHNAYSICPAKGSEEHYVVLVDALAKRAPLKPGFDAAAFVEHLLTTEVHEGQLNFTYHRA